jgi:hypothetical protein
MKQVASASYNRLQAPPARRTKAPRPTPAQRTTAVRAAEWLQPRIEAHNRAVKRHTITGVPFYGTVAGMCACWVSAMVGLMSDEVTFGALLMLVGFAGTGVLHVGTSLQPSFLALNGKTCTFEARMPPMRVIERLVQQRPDDLERALLEHVIHDAELVLSCKIPEE